MTNFTLIKLTVTESIPVSETRYEYNVTGPLNSTSAGSSFRVNKLMQIFIILICTLGMLGNCLVIWLLGFCIKRNLFTTYILNLSVADLGFLITEWITFNPVSPIFENAFLLNTIYFMYSASQCFLTIISVDRCVSVFFPLWYRCHRPKHLSAMVCSLIWVISFLPPGIAQIVYKGEKDINPIVGYQVIVNGSVCLPLMFISSLMMVSKICSKLEGRKQRKLLIMILATVVCFFICSFPVNTWCILYHFLQTPIHRIPFSDDIFACLNSSVNPIIYGLVGKPKKGCSLKSMKTMLQGLFSGEELSVQPTEEVETPLECYKKDQNSGDK